MFKSMLCAAVFLMAGSVFADVNFSVGFDSAYVEGVGKVSIRSVEGGKLWVQWDRNVCSADGRNCTKMAFPGREITPRVIDDGRGTDGDLLLDLTQLIQLSVGSGFNLARTIDYTAVLLKDNGQNVRVPLKTRVFTSIK